MKPHSLGAFAALCLTVSSALAAPNFSVGEIPKLANKDGQGLLIDLLRHMETIDGTAIEFAVTPPARSIANVKTGSKDVHMPMIDPGRGRSFSNDELMFSEATLGSLEFGIFHPDTVTLDINNLEGLQFETLSATSDLFEMPIGASNCLPCTLKKVMAGRLDGLITARFVGEQVVAGSGTEGVAYTPFTTFPTRFVLRNGDTETDQWLSTMIHDLRDAGTLQQILPMYKQPD